jgi:lauroyl/myristoyl acyltransferase
MRPDPRAPTAPSEPREPSTELRYRLSIWLAKVFSWFFWLLPPVVRNSIADIVAMGFFHFSRAYRDNVQSNLRQVLGESAPQSAVRRAARNVFRTSAHNFLDLMLVPRRSTQRLVGDVHLNPADRESLDSLIAGGKGVVIVTAHLGAFDYIGQGLHLLGYRLTIVTGKTVARFIYDGVVFLRSAKGARMVEPTPSGVRQALKALRRGECVAFVSDRDYLQNGRELTFFGRKTTLPPGAIRMARDTGAPVQPIFTRRVKGGHEMRLFPSFQVPRTANQDEDIATGFQKLVSVLEAAIGSSPDQWVMFQRVWRDEPVDPVRAFPVGSPFAPESSG